MNRTEKREESKRGAEGFTLIEVLLVVVIIGLLAAVALPRLGSRKRDAEKGTAKGSLAGISVAIDLYEADNGQLPSGLQSLITKGSEQDWNGPYLKDAKLPIDPWQTPIQYTAKDNGYELRSAGPDKAFGSADDIVK